MSKLYFFRHGQASINSDNYDKLSQKGVKQAQLLGHYLIKENIRFDRVFCGPLVRQLETEREVRKVYQTHQQSYPEATVLQGLKEHTGMDVLKNNYSALLKKHSFLQELQHKSIENPALKQQYYMEAFGYFMQKWALNALELDGIPLWQDFRRAVGAALKTLLAATEKGETVGVFSSGGTISAILAESLGMEKEDRIAELNYSVRNASVSQFLYSAPRFSLLEFNAVHFLPKELITFV